MSLEYDLAGLVEFATFVFWKLFVSCLNYGNCSINELLMSCLRNIFFYSIGKSLTKWYISSASHFVRPEKFDGLLQRLQTLEAQKLPPSNLKSISQLLSRLSENIKRALVLESQRSKRHLIGTLTDIGSCKPASCSISEAGWFACWVPFDICMENVMDGKQFPVTSAIDILSGESYFPEKKSV